MNLKKFCVVLTLCCAVVSCSRSVDSCRRDADGVMRALTRELEAVKTTRDLQLHLPKIRRLYLELAELVIAVDRAYDGKEWGAATPDNDVSEALRIQLIHIYELPRGQELMEEAQMEAIYRLGRRSPGRRKP